MNTAQTFTFLLMTLILGLSGCASPVAVARNFPLGDRWEVIAADLARETALSEGTRLDGRPLYVQTGQEGVALHQGFRNLMITHLVNMGLPVSDAPFGALKIDYETQIVRHDSPMPASQPGTLEVLPGGILVARSPASGSESPRIEPGAAGGAVTDADLATSHFSSPTHIELVVTTSIVDNGRFVMRKSAVYFVEELDMTLFRHPMPTKTLEVTGQ